MKTTVTFLTFLSLSMVYAAPTPVFAPHCNNAALEIAKVNLDKKARAYGFNSSFILKSSLKKVAEDFNIGSVSYSVEGSIYRANYTLDVVLDSSCSLTSLAIRED